MYDCLDQIANKLCAVKIFRPGNYREAAANNEIAILERLHREDPSSMFTATIDLANIVLGGS